MGRSEKQVKFRVNESEQTLHHIPVGEPSHIAYSIPTSWSGSCQYAFTYQVWFHCHQFLGDKTTHRKRHYICLFIAQRLYKCNAILCHVAYCFRIFPRRGSYTTIVESNYFMLCSHPILYSWIAVVHICSQV